MLALLAVLFAPRVEACSCMMEKGTHAEQVLEALNDAGVMFVARLRSTNKPVWMETIVKPAVGAEDGISGPAEFSKDWLIYGDGPGPYELSQCSRSAPLNVGGAKDLKLLREFIKHPPKWPLAPSASSRR
jgi:hypothetical protein